MRAVGLVLCLFFGAVGIVVTMSAPASACSCASVSLKKYVAGADVIVTGTLTEIEESSGGVFGSGPGEASYRVAVESTYKGRATENLVFTTSGDGASCGVEGLDVARRYTFFLHGSDGELTSSLCSGNRPSADSVDRQVVALTGSPKPPVPGGPDRSDPDPARWLPWTLGGLVVVAGVAWWRRRWS